MKGILLAGGAGTRLHPVTIAVSKQLLPVYDKPMVFYPLSLLMLAGIREILVVTTPQDADAYRRLLGNGDGFGVRLAYAAQERPMGLAHAFIVGRDFLAGAPACLALGDNLLHGNGLGDLVRAAAATRRGACVFAYQVRDASQYGVVDFDAAGAPTALVEKPAAATSRWAVPGLYFYGPDVVDEAAALTPSTRGELEITDLNRRYLARGELTVRRLGRGFAWFDTGTPRGLLDAANFIAAIDERQGLKVGCLEEIAWRSGWIDRAQLLARAVAQPGGYGDYLRALLDGEGQRAEHG